MSRGDWPWYWANGTSYMDISGYAVGPLKAIGLRAENDQGATMPLESVKVSVKESGATSIFK